MKRIVMIGTIAAIIAVSGLSAMDRREPKDREITINHAGDRFPNKKTMQYFNQCDQLLDLFRANRERETRARTAEPRGNPHVRRRLDF